MSLVIYFFGCVVIFLPTAFAGNVSCSTCPSNPPQSPSQCNMSNTTTICGPIHESFCFAVTAELNNGSFTSSKGCFVNNVCNSTTACQRAKNDIGVGFKRCVGRCCQYNDDCNKYLVPDSWKEEPSSTTPAATSTAPNVTSTPPPAIRTTPNVTSTPPPAIRTTPNVTPKSAASTKGTSALIMYLLLIFLLL